MKYQDYNDEELMMMINESSEEAKDIIYRKYHYIIDIIFKKYLKSALVLGIEPTDLFQEAMVGFTDAINCYQEEKEASFATFATLCIERRLHTIISKALRYKDKYDSDTMSLEYEYDENGLTLKDLVVDRSVPDPLNTIENKEYQINLEIKIKEVLSDNEYTVYQLMIQGLNYQEIAKILNKEPKQVDNAIQRIRGKIRKLIEKE